MAYMGNSPAEIYSSVQKQTITGNGTVGPYTLDYSVTNANEISVFVNNVRQEPGSGKAYTVSGDQLTMTGTVASTDDFYVIFSGLTQGTITPPDASVTKAKMNTTELDLSTIKDGTGTNTAMTIDSSGRIFTPARPSFLCRPSAAISYTTASWKMPDFDTVDHDIGSNLHADGYFVAPVAGVYHFNYGARLDSVASGFVIIALAHNNTGTAPLGSALYSATYFLIGTPNSAYDSLTTAVTIQLSANDKVVPWLYSADTSWSVSTSSSFSGFLLG